MTLKYKTRAFVFKKSDRNESDRIFSVFTDDFGRLDIFAKAIRKITSKLRGGIDIFSLSEIEFIQGKNRKTLTDATAIKRFSSIPQSPEKYEMANRMGEVLDNFIKGEEKDKGIFDLLNEVLAELDALGALSLKLQLLHYYFLWNAMSLLGYRPQVEKCNVCHGKLNPYSIYFSDKSGGTICKNCSTLGGEQRISSDVVKILRLIFRKDWQILSRLKIEPVSQKLFEKVSDNYYSYTLSSHSFKNN